MADWFQCEIPNEPDDVQIVLDRDGDLWQRTGRNTWTCIKAKIPGVFTNQSGATWRHLVYAFGPLRAVPLPEES